MFSPSSSRGPLATILTAGVALSFALGAALVTSVISAAPASAHAVLVRITPAPDAQLTAAPTQVVMEFNEPVNTTFVTVAVTNAAGVGVAKGKARVQGATVTQALSPNLASGDYRIAFRVTSDDGHPVTGESKFKLALASETSPTTSPGTPSAAPTDPVRETRTDPVRATPLPDRPDIIQESWPALLLAPIAGAVALLFMGAAALLLHRRRR